MTKSKAEKALSGSLRPDRLRNIHKVRPLTKLPKAPADLSASASAAWRQIGELAVKLGTLSEFDIPILELTARTLGTVCDLEAVIARDGSIMQSGEVRKAHPALAAADRSRLLAHRLLSEFGLAPMSREKLSLDAPKDDGANPFDRF